MKLDMGGWGSSLTELVGEMVGLSGLGEWANLDSSRFAASNSASAALGTFVSGCPLAALKKRQCDQLSQRLGEWPGPERMVGRGVG